MKISIIAAIGENRELGKDNKLLWNIREDLKHFQKVTKNHIVIMGRKTFDSIGKPLPNRVNIIITRNPTNISHYNVLKHCNEEVIFSSSLTEALDLFKKKSAVIKNNNVSFDEIFIIGGGQIYSEGIKYANKLYLTIVKGKYQADTFFPNYSDFKKVISEEQKQEGNYKFKFVELER